MANSSNVYNTAEPLKGSVSDWIGNQEQMDFAKRGEQRQIDAIDEARKLKEQARQDKLREKLLGDTPQNYNTGSSSLNLFQAGIIQKGVNRMGEIYSELRKPNLSDDDRTALEIEYANLEKLPENLKVSTDNFSKIIADYNKGVADGTYFRNPDFEKKVLSGFDSYVGGLDNGLPIVGFRDLDGDGQMDVMPYENLQQGIGVWDFQKQYDLDKLAVATGEKLGSVEGQTDRNFVKRTTKGPDLKALDTITTNILQNTDGTPTEAALSELKKRGLESTPENLNTIKQIFKERVLAYTDRSDKSDFDYNAQRMAAKDAQEARKGNGKEDKTYSLNDLNLTANTKRTAGDKSELVSNIYQGNVNIPRKVGKASENFRSFAIDRDGNVIVTVDVEMPNEDSAPTITTKQYNSNGDADDVAFFAQRFKDPETGRYIETIGQLKQKLNSRGGSELGEPKKKQIPGYRPN